MHRSNPLAWANAALMLGAAVLAWYVLHDFPYVSKLVFAVAYLALLSLTGFWMWRHGQRRARLIEDIPTSRIATASQGYVELLGQAVVWPDTPLVAGLSGTPCLWYRWEIARRASGSGSRDLVTAVMGSIFYWPEASESSQQWFGIDDGSGTALIFPHGAEVIATHRQVWHEGDARYMEERIMPGDPLYVLGDFSTHDPARAPFNLMHEISARISVWRADQPALPRRFDANRNGLLDAEEWDAMHREALRMARDKEAEHLARPVVHWITMPEHGRQYLLSSRAPDDLAGHYRFWRGLGLGFFLGGGALAVWIFGHWLLA